MSISGDIIYYPYKAIRPVYERTNWHRKVIDEVDSPRLRWAYSHCRDITRQFAKTFYLATRFLPREKQRSIFAIYALCRYLDNIVDDAADPEFGQNLSAEQLRSVMEEWKTHLSHAYNRFDTDNPILLAFTDMLRSHKISIDLPLELIDGVCMDITKNRYADFSELYTYSYKVASVVGLMTSEVFGYEDPKALDYAVDLGIAMQLTNILRDIGEDLKRDRIYLPQDEMRHFGVTDESLKSGVIDQNFISMMHFQIRRARHYYERAANGIPLLNRDSRLPVLLAHHNYNRILNRIEENQFDVFSQRAHLSMSEKLAILPRVWAMIDKPDGNLTNPAG